MRVDALREMMWKVPEIVVVTDMSPLQEKGFYSNTESRFYMNIAALDAASKKDLKELAQKLVDRFKPNRAEVLESRARPTIFTRDIFKSSFTSAYDMSEAAYLESEDISKSLYVYLYPYTDAIKLRK